MTVAASATGTSGNGKGFTSVLTPALKNFTAWQAGAQIGYAGFKFGGGYVDAENYNVRTGTDSGDQHAWNAGASYTTGPIASASPMSMPKATRALAAPMPRSTRSMASAAPTPSPPACCCSRT